MEEEWLNWLKEEHIQEVLSYGAKGASVVKLDNDHEKGGPATYEIRYMFPDRDSYNTYLNEHAVKLRQKTYATFSPADGFHYHRTSGDIIASFTAP